MQRHRRQADDALHAGAHERVGRFLCRRPRNGEHGDLDAEIAHQRLHAGGVEASAAVDAVPGELGVHVERGHDGDRRGCRLEVRKDGAPEVADTDQRHVLALGASEEAADALDAGGHVVASVGTAGVPAHHEVAAHLRGAHHGVAGQLVRVDALHALVLQ